MSFFSRKSPLRPFNGEMIAECLRRRGNKFRRDDDGDCIAGYASPDGKVMLLLTLQAVGSKGRVFALRAHAPMRFPSEVFDAIMRLCNEWNADRRWPKAYLRRGDDGKDGEICLEEHLLMPRCGIPEDLVETLIEVVIDSSFEFWKWAMEVKLVGHLAEDSILMFAESSAVH